MNLKGIRAILIFWLGIATLFGYTALVTYLISIYQSFLPLLLFLPFFMWASLVIYETEKD